MNKHLLPSERDDFFSESQELREVLLALVVDEVVEVLPVEDQLNESSILERTEQRAYVDVGNVGALVRLDRVVLVQHDHALLQQVAVDGLLLGFLDLHHGWQQLIRLLFIYSHRLS